MTDQEASKRRRGIYLLPSLFTTGALFAGFYAIIEALKRLEPDETLLVQSGKPVGVFTTHEDAPRVLIANSNLVPAWADWSHFNELDRAGLMMYGQMTAGSWIYIASQGIVQGTYETFAEAARQHQLQRKPDHLADHGPRKDRGRSLENALRVVDRGGGLLGPVVGRGGVLGRRVGGRPGPVGGALGGGHPGRRR